MWLIGRSNLETRPYPDISRYKKQKTKNYVAFSPQANYTDRATTAVDEVSANFLRVDGVALSEQRIPTAVTLVFLDWSR
jgi:hypothetical protein